MTKLPAECSKSECHSAYNSQLSNGINKNTDESEWHSMAESHRWNDDLLMLCFLRFLRFSWFVFKPINANHISAPVATLVAVGVKTIGNRFTHSSLVESDNKWWTVGTFAHSSFRSCWLSFSIYSIVAQFACNILMWT